MNSNPEQKTPEHNWTLEKLQALGLKAVRIVRDNATRKGVKSLVDLCEQVILAKTPPAQTRTRTALKSEIGEIVEEYHFVCRNDRGVTLNSDGTFWSASWVVDEAVARESIKYGARLALHTSRQEPSYRQGAIKDIRRVEYQDEGEIKSRLDFLVSPESNPLPWAGRATGEKGYKRRKIAEKQPSVLAGEGQ